jgi:uncharacterized protein YjaZ
MGVMNTDEWLLEHFHDPIVICKKILQNQSESGTNQEPPNPQHYYRYLLHFGMYKPTRQAKKTFNTLKQQDTWNLIEKLFSRYQQKWNGPDIPVYIFPMTANRSLFHPPYEKKSGVSFPDRLFLFLQPDLSETEIEALLVHEYHHVCRMQHADKPVEEYVLLDSIILEGLAEAIVAENCGEDYLAKWTRFYSDSQMQTYWRRFLEKNLTVKKTERLHDRLLFGGNGIPLMLGYAAGYALVDRYKKTRRLKEHESFSINSKAFLDMKF